MKGRPANDEGATIYVMDNATGKIVARANFATQIRFEPIPNDDPFMEWPQPNAIRPHWTGSYHLTAEVKPDHNSVAYTVFNDGVE